MTIGILSDIHLEFFGSRWRAFVLQLPVACDVLVLAGDVCSPGAGVPTLADALEAFCDRFGRVVYVLGNHEYYRTSPGVVAGWMREAERRRPRAIGSFCRARFVRATSS